MPHVEIKCFPGRTEEQKRKCAEKIAEDISEMLDCKLSTVSVAIKEVEQKTWKEDVWEKVIMAEKDCLYKEPGYSYD